MVNSQDFMLIYLVLKYSALIDRFIEYVCRELVTFIL